jgi:putative oxidoreductase
MTGLFYWIIGLFSRIPLSLSALLARLAVGLVFWNSGRTKVAGWDLLNVTENTKFLFSEEYKLPYIPPETAALLAQISEHVFSVLIIIGLATRFSALALLGMTLVIQILVYPNAYALHASWAALFLYLMKYGPGSISVDHLIQNRR